VDNYIFDGADTEHVKIVISRFGHVIWLLCLHF